MYKILLLIILANVYLVANETAEQLEKRFEQEKKPTFDSEIEIPRLQKKIDFNDEKLKKIILNLNSIVIKDSTIYSEHSFKNKYKHLLNKNISFNKVIELINKINQDIKKEYSLSRLYIPQQRIKNGILILKVQESFVGEVEIINGTKKDRDIIEKVFDALKKEKPLRTETWIKKLLIIKKLHGIKIETKVAESKIPNATKFIINIDKTDNFGGFISLDNRGTEATGPLQITAGVTINNPFGHYSRTDLLYARTGNSKELDYFSLSHNYPLNENGLSLNFSVGYSKSEPGIQALRSIDQKSDSKSFSIGFEYPYILKRNESLTFTSRLDMRNSNSLSLNSKISEDKTRIFRLGLEYSLRDTTGSDNQIILEYSKGLPILGSIEQGSDLKSRADGNINFDKVNINLNRETRFKIKDENSNERFSNWSLYTAIEAQISADSLLSGEECGVGGKQFGRAYDSSEITGDTCYSFSIEPRYTFDKVEGLKALQVYSYWDIGEARNRNSSTTNPKSESIASAGLGFRFSITDKLSGSLEFAKPLTKTVANKENRKTRVFANLVYVF